MEQIIDIAIRFGAGFLGILIYSLLTVYGKISLNEFSFSKHWTDNKNRWIVSLLILLVVAVTVTLIDGVGEAIKTGTGLAITETIASFWTLGYGLGSGTKKMVKKNTN